MEGALKWFKNYPFWLFLVSLTYRVQTDEVDPND